MRRTRKFRLQELAIAALLEKPTIKDAADSVGIDESTLRHWLADPPILASYSQARRSILDRAVTRLLALTGDAVATLKRNLDSGNVAGEIRAALGVLKGVYQGIEVLDLGREISELRAELERMKHGSESNPAAAWPNQASA
jgi:hypothetical protein